MINLHEIEKDMSIVKPNRYLILLICLMISLPSMAKRVNGYIISNSGDTLNGYIKVYRFDRATGVWIINGIDMQCYHMDVSFKNEDGGKFKTYIPEDILGFGFAYQGREFKFQRFVLEPKNIFSREGSKIYRFLSLEHSGKISLFRDIIRVSNPSSGLMSNIPNFFFDYYIFLTGSGLKKLEVKDEQDSLVKILADYGFEEEFLDGLPHDTKLKDIKAVLESYDLWYEGKQKGS
jgi:hypothetical protein